jgi:catechol 2,3-dioxygenase-like lactoylglutathione lyase family enzyme
MQVNLTHNWLLVDDMPRALGFYRDTLGLEVLNDLGEFVEFNVNPQFQLALFTQAAMRQGEPGIPLSPVAGQRSVLAFEVEALDEYCAGLRASGVEFVSAEANHPAWGLRTAFLRDPDGNLLCLYGGIPE